jgi:nitrate/nitrite transporter NarK
LGDPTSSLTVVVASTIVGLIAAAAGGYVAARIGRARWPSAVVAVLIVVGALISLAARPGGGAVWSQLVALFLLAPTALFVSYGRRSGRSDA